FSKGYFGFDISGTIPFHRPTKWVQYKVNRNIARGFSLSVPRPFVLKTESLKHPPAILIA
ncbi:hypothetical protein, partial [Atlantibacter hermannii]|uniref:hypothetical protein n=1 Tax=Atlantibacter hermannii TaxID=565 RepID=UPI002072D276